MMKRLSLLALFAALALLAFTGIAFANFGIHGGYLADTDACAGCHRAHTAPSGITWVDNSGGTRSGLLVGTATLLYQFCYTCHGDLAPGASTDVQTGQFDSLSVAPTASDSSIGGPLNGGGFDEFYSWAGSSGTVTSNHLYNGSSWNAWGEGTTGPGKLIAMDCASCHDVHGSSNYRILKDEVNGLAVGGYGAGFSSAANPTPDPWVISNEVGYPVGNTAISGGPDTAKGFRLHTQYDGVTVNYSGVKYQQYLPDYTTARYARPVTSGEGISGWCTACHEQYDNRTGTSANTYLTAVATVGGTSLTVADSSGFIAGDKIQIGFDFATGAGFNKRAEWRVVSSVPSGTQINLTTALSYGHEAPSGADRTEVYDAYDAGDGVGAVVRHRHPVNVPLSGWYKGGVEANGAVGDRVLIYEPTKWQTDFPTYGPRYVDIPLEHAAGGQAGGANDGDGLGSSQVNNIQDYIGCLTCHRAHGTDATMTGYAAASLDGSGRPYGPPTYGGYAGVPPANAALGAGIRPSQLLRADNRGVCERCHNK